MSTEEFDKQQTGEISAVKPPTMNSLILDRITYLEATLADGLQIAQWFAKISEQQEVLKLLYSFLLVVGLLCLAEGVYIITAISLLFGKVTH